MANELILIVEDNEKNRKLVRDVLQHRGYRTLEAETGEDGVRLAREHHPALILMDIQLPGIDGIAALGQLRSDPATRAVPVIAVTASAGAQARAVVEREHPDLVLLDVVMPEMSGYEVCRKIRDNPASAMLPVVMVTALDPTQERVKGIEAGADDFLTKPINQPE